MARVAPLDVDGTGYGGTGVGGESGRQETGDGRQRREFRDKDGILRSKNRTGWAGTRTDALVIFVPLSFFFPSRFLLCSPPAVADSRGD